MAYRSTSLCESTVFVYVLPSFQITGSMSTIPYFSSVVSVRSYWGVQKPLQQLDLICFQFLCGRSKLFEPIRPSISSGLAHKS